MELICRSENMNCKQNSVSTLRSCRTLFEKREETRISITDRMSCEKWVNGKSSKRTKSDTDEETKEEKTPGDMKLTVVARGKALYSLWIEKKILKKNNPPFNRKRSWNLTAKLKSYKSQAAKQLWEEKHQPNHQPVSWAYMYRIKSLRLHN